MTEPRIVPPAEARELVGNASLGPWEWMNCHVDVGWTTTQQGVANAELLAAAPDLAHTAAVLGDQRGAVLALHQPTEIQVITGLCAKEECDHEDSCPTVPISVCGECQEVAEAGNPYALEYPNATERVLYPCPTARALGVTE